VFDFSGLTSAPTGILYVDGSSGNDTLIGSNFADSLRGGTGDDQLNGGLGDDLLTGDKGIDSLDGGDGDDRLNGGAGNDALFGGEDDDTFVVLGKEALGDTFSGGLGVDKIEVGGTAVVTLAGFDVAAASIEEWHGNGKAVLGTKLADAFDFSGLTSAPVGILYVDASSGNDTLVGSNFADNLRGGAGADQLTGGLGDDLLTGGKDNDSFVYRDGYGADTVADYLGGIDKFDLTGVSGLDIYADVHDRMQASGATLQDVTIDFGGGNTLTILKTTIAFLDAHSTDFLI
jgi:Ca2+-binding RTX toxin-like protein